MAIEYENRVDDNGEPQECDCCSFPGRLHEFKAMMVHGGQEDLWLCEVCSQTYLSVARKYPAQCPDVQLYKSIAIIANMLLEEIRKTQ